MSHEESFKHVSVLETVHLSQHFLLIRFIRTLRSPCNQKTKRANITYKNLILKYLAQSSLSCLLSICFCMLSKLTAKHIHCELWVTQFWNSQKLIDNYWTLVLWFLFVYKSNDIENMSNVLTNECRNVDVYIGIYFKVITSNLQSVQNWNVSLFARC